VIKIIKILLVWVALLVVIDALLSSKLHVERSVIIKAPQGEVFHYLNHQNINKWSPWQRIDSDPEYRYFGSKSGVNAKMAWHSANGTVGSGSRKIIESLAYEFICVKLDFDGMKMAESRYLMTANGSNTCVTWTFYSDAG